jgi:hypothetical protein
VIKDETIFSAAATACELARRTGRNVDFRFNGTEVTARPDSSMLDLAEVWFWKRQWEHIQAVKV